MTSRSLTNALPPYGCKNRSKNSYACSSSRSPKFPKRSCFIAAIIASRCRRSRPGTLSVCSPESGRTEFAIKSADLPTTGRRLAFAHWLTGPDNPLTARVIANRVWMHHFGRGLVSTPADFGRLGTLPTHPAVAGLAGLGIPRFGLESEASASFDHAFHGVPPVVAS